MLFLYIYILFILLQILNSKKEEKNGGGVVRSIKSNIALTIFFSWRKKEEKKCMLSSTLTVSCPFCLSPGVTSFSLVSKVLGHWKLIILLNSWVTLFLFVR